MDVDGKWVLWDRRTIAINTRENTVVLRTKFANAYGEHAPCMDGDCYKKAEAKGQLEDEFSVVSAGAPVDLVLVKGSFARGTLYDSLSSIIISTEEA